MSITKSVDESLMKIVVRIADVVALAKRFEQSPALAMREVVTEMRDGVRDVLERVMAAEIELFLGRGEEAGNKRNGFVSRAYGIEGVGTVKLRVPRDPAGRFSSNVVPASRRYDEATEKDIALLNLSGLSTRMLARMSGPLLGIRVSQQEVSNALHKIVHAAKAFLSRPRSLLALRSLQRHFGVGCARCRAPAPVPSSLSFSARSRRAPATRRGHRARPRSHG